MYTGESIDLDDLMQKNSKWDKDHIYPTSKIKDDSIDNLVLVDKTVNNTKDNNVLGSGSWRGSSKRITGSGKSS